MTTTAFDINKTVAAAAFIAQKRSGGISIFVLLKKMYAAEREALTSWHRSITGDNFCSMKGGVVLSRTYNLIKGEIRGADGDIWSAHFGPRIGDKVKLNTAPDFDYLSQRERDALDRADARIEALIKQHGLIKDILHEAWPEWKNPEGTGRGSIPLEIQEILSQETRDDDEIQRICLEIDTVQSAKAALQTH